jgi:predicted DNA-binding transcriptional regulator AlpA
MSLREAEQHRARHAQRKHRKRQKRKIKVRGRPVGIGHNLGPSLAPLLDDRCLTFNEWCTLAGIGQRTGRRLIKAGSGPPVVQLSDRRIGIRVGAHRAWLKSRERA